MSQPKTPPHVKRMKTEHADLDRKIEALRTAVSEESLLADDQERDHKICLMNVQLRHMINYWLALGQRIEFES